MRVGLVGNCQVASYKRLFETSSWAGQLEVREVEVWRYRPSELRSFFDLLKDCDWVITQELSDHYAPLNTANLKRELSRVCVIQNIYFSGFHPDCTYLGPMGNRAKSPIGDYHSEYVFNAWRDNMPIRDCAAGLVNYPERSIQERFESGQAELVKRERAVDVPVSDLVVDRGFGSRNFFVFNHPKLALHRAYLERILDFLRLPIELKDCDDPLEQYGSFPVYPAVQRSLGVQADDAFEFVAPVSMGGRKYDPESFCAASYSLYEKEREGLINWGM